MNDMKEGTGRMVEPEMPARWWGTQDGCEHKCLCLCSDGVEGTEQGRGVASHWKAECVWGEDSFKLRQYQEDSSP